MKTCKNCNREIPDWYSTFLGCCCGNCLIENEDKQQAIISFYLGLEAVLK